jgi:hypothetical protein
MGITVEGSLTLDQFARRMADMAKPGFLAKHPRPFLLIELRKGGLSVKGRFTPEAPTVLEEGEEAQALAGSNLLPSEVAVVPLDKTGRNEFEEAVTLGRATNNDVVVLYPSVSKLHAVFRIDAEKEAFTVTDADSSFGTVIGTRQIEPGQPATLYSGVAVVFGKAVRSNFFTPGDLYEYIKIQRKFKRLP